MRALEDPHQLSLYMRTLRTEALGPGSRYALWVQGCPFRCQGCLASESLPSEGGEWITVETLASEILSVREGLEGITISGGEPFMQASALSQLIQLIRAEWDAGVIVYSGFTLEQLQRRADSVHSRAIRALLDQIDLLIDGQYIESLNDGKSLRGSSNQVVTPLSERYLDSLDLYGQQGRKVELLVRPNQTFNLVGVPPLDLLDRLRAPQTRMLAPPTLSEDTDEWNQRENS